MHHSKNDRFYELMEVQNLSKFFEKHGNVDVPIYCAKCQKKPFHQKKNKKIARSSKDKDHPYAPLSLGFVMSKISLTRQKNG